MTLKEFLSMPQGYTPEQWQKELNLRKRIESKLRRLSTERDFLEDSYAMTEDMKIKRQLDETQHKTIIKVTKVLCISLYSFFIAFDFAISYSRLI